MYEPTPEKKIGDFVIKGEDFFVEGKRDVYVDDIKMVRIKIISKMSWIKSGIVWFGDECKPYLPKIDGKYIMALKYKGEKLENGLTEQKCIYCDNHVRIPPSFRNQKIDGAICYENCLKGKNRFPDITFIDMENGLASTGTINIANEYEAYRSSAISPLLERHDVTSIDAKNGNFSIYYYFNPKNSGIVLFLIKKGTVQTDIYNAWGI